MKQAVVVFGAIMVAVMAALIIMVTGLESTKKSMLESVSSDCIYELMIDMKIKEMDWSYQELIDSYLTSMATNLNGSDDLRVEILSIDKESGIIDINNVLTYTNFFNQEKSIATRKTIVFNTSANPGTVQVDFVVDGIFKEAVIIKKGATYQEVIDKVGVRASWDVDPSLLNLPLNNDTRIYSI